MAQRHEGLDLLFYTASLGTVALDGAGTIVRVNGAFERMFGYAPDELLGQPLEKLLPEPLRPAYITDRERFVRKPHVRPLGQGVDLQGQHKGGQLFPIEVSLSPIQVNGELITVAFITDISERKLLEQERVQLLAQERRLRAAAEAAQRRRQLLADTARLLASSLDYQATLSDLTWLLVPDLCDGCAIHLIEAELLQLCAAAGFPADQAASGAPSPVPELLCLDDPSLIAASVRSQQPALFSDIPAYLDRQRGDATGFQRYTAAGIRSLVVVPIALRGRSLGALSLWADERRPPYDQEALALAQELALQIAQAVENARLFDKAQQIVQQQEEALGLLQTMMQSAPFGLGLLDRELRYRQINGHLAELGGWPPEAGLGRSLADMPPQLSATMASAVCRVLETGQPFSGVELRGVDGAGPGCGRTWLTSYYPVHSGESLLGVGVMAQDITERVRAETALRESERRYRTLANNIPNGSVMLFDHDLRFIIADGSALSEAGHSRENVEGRTLWDVLPPTLTEMLEPHYRAALAGERSELEIAAHGRIYLSYFVPVRNEQGIVAAGMVMSYDVTQLKQVETALMQERALLARRVAERTADLSAANAELARAARLKDEFLASMSHELRTPLNAVLGLTEALCESTYGPMTARQVEVLNLIEESGRHLLALINDILDLAKIGAGKLELELSPVPVAELCEASLRMVRLEASKKRISIDLSLAAASSTVYGDSRRLKQVLVNLLSNAVKFTPAGGAIGLEVTGQPEEQAIRFAVWDTGIGIGPEQLGRLFRPFIQLDSTLARQYEGTGLGLNLVYRMTELHGGSVSVASSVGVGSRFTVTLPWAGEAAHQADVAPADGSQSDRPIAGLGATGDGVRSPAPVILLVEDNEPNIMTISDFLQARGYEVVLARNGPEALWQAQKRLPALVLMDVQLPVMDGLEVTRRFRADPAFDDIPIIAVTALAMQGDRDRCLAAGADDYLSKPVRLKELAEQVVRHLRHGRRVATHQPPSP